MKCEVHCSSQKLILSKLVKISGRRMVSELLARVRVLSRVTCMLPFDIESLINHLTVPPPPNQIHTNSLLVP